MFNSVVCAIMIRLVTSVNYKVINAEVDVYFSFAFVLIFCLLFLFHLPFRRSGILFNESKFHLFTQA